MPFILGKKIEMSQIFDEKGNVVPVTLVEAGPCFVLQIKTKDSKNGYDSVQIGFEKKVKHIKKTEKGKEFKYIKEFRMLTPSVNSGDKIDVSVFQEGDKVKVSGVSKGKGFQGGVKRYHFRGHPQTHGVKHEVRTIGSVGSTNPDRVIPGKRMPGHMGFERVSVKKLKIVKIDAENNLIAIKGAIPGRRGTLIEIRSLIVNKKKK
ncbi:MAG: 50S ribosomal protein L3 [Candidatus Pacebacteria bacterium]|nr:50S ribosomal protein L3 [Candidatus Paceibacterota bacterium]